MRTDRFWQAAEILGALVLWQGLALMEVAPRHLFPGPVDVAVRLGELSLTELHRALLVTIGRLLIGYTGAAVVGVALGVGLAQRREISALAGPAVQVMRAVPTICWFPLAVLWLGQSEWTILLMVAIGTLCEVASATEEAIRVIPPRYIHAAATMGVRGWRLYERVMLPAAFPTLLTGLRMGWSFSWRCLMAAELLVRQGGLGDLLGAGGEAHDPAQVIAVIAMILTIGLLVDRQIFARAEWLVVRRWGPQVTGDLISG
ncbi:MAG TPA: ABC transporter permease [Symbiobacteriaceae bacterium]|nr:ABC transporter permease [Symbiobacteriaceae bacterium]